jgi:CDGSH-type Zn-finger protein
MSNDAVIMPTNNGPYRVQGNFRIVLPGGRELDAQGETWLCRCGASQDKPFCDGSHARIGFKATEADVAAEHIATPTKEVALTA